MKHQSLAWLNEWLERSGGRLSINDIVHAADKVTLEAFSFEMHQANGVVIRVDVEARIEGEMERRVTAVDSQGNSGRSGYGDSKKVN